MVTYMVILSIILWRIKMGGIFNGDAQAQGDADRARAKADDMTKQADKDRQDYLKQQADAKKKQDDLDKAANAEKDRMAQKQARAVGLSFGVNPLAQSGSQSSLLG